MNAQEIQRALNDKFGKGKVTLLSLRRDGTINVKGMFEDRIKVRYFLKKINVMTLNNVAEKRKYTAVIGIG